MLPKQHRLPASQFQSVFRSGQKIFADDFVCILQKSSGNVSRFAFVVSTKVAKYAIDRNRMKRVLRESVHHLLTTIRPGYDIVFVAKKNFAMKKEKDIEQIVRGLYSKLSLLLNHETQT